MKPEEIDLLPAGGDLNMLIATELFGCSAQIVGRENGQRLWECGCYPHIHNGNYAFIEPYSTDITAAWLVVEKIRKKIPNYIFGMNVFQGQNCAAFYYSIRLNETIHYTEAATAPLAICRAALKTVIGEKE